MPSVGGSGGHGPAPADYHRPDEGHPASGTDHSSNLLRNFKEIDLGQFKETDRFPISKQEAKDAARELKDTVKGVADVHIDAFEKTAETAKADVKALEAQLEAQVLREQERQATAKALLEQEKQGKITLTDEDRTTSKAWAEVDLNTTTTRQREKLEEQLNQARDNQQSTVRELEEARVHATKLLEQAKEFAKPWIDSTKWWRPLKSRDARLELVVRRTDHQIGGLEHQNGQLAEVLQGLRTELAGLRTHLAAGGDTPPPDPPRGDHSDESRPVAPRTEPVRPIDNPTAGLPRGTHENTAEEVLGFDPELRGVRPSDIYFGVNNVYDTIDRNPHNTVERERFELIQRALDGVPGDTAHERIETLANWFRNRDTYTPEQQQYVDSWAPRWDLLREALRSSPDQIDRIYGRIEEGVLTREYHLLEMGEDDARLTLANRALEGLGDTPDEQLRELFNRYRGPLASDADREDAAQRLANLRLALHASPEDLALLQTQMSAEELKTRIGRSDDDEQVLANRVVGADNNADRDARIDELDAQQQQGGDQSMRAYRTMMILQAVQQGLQGIIQGLFQFAPPQS